MKVIFLDIDGVLTTPSSGYRLIPEKVKLLNKMKGWSVVISSSWGYCEDTINALKGCGLELPIIGGIRDWWIDEVDRTSDILKWIKENNPEDWIILDDEDIDIPGFTKIDGNVGLEKLEKGI